MIRLLYFSTARPSVGTAEFRKIVESAEVDNAQHGITGALAFNGRNFCQVLEGEESAVRSLMQRISEDSRHSGIKVLDEKEVTERHFDGWTMQMVSELDFSEVINAMHA